jgi:hypothetical protein
LRRRDSVACDQGGSATLAEGDSLPDEDEESAAEG